MLIPHPPDWIANGGPADEDGPAGLQVEPSDNDIPGDPDSKFLVFVELDSDNVARDVIREMRADFAHLERIDGLKWTERTSSIGPVAACEFESRSSLVAPPGGITETQRCDCVTRSYVAEWPTGGVLLIQASVIYPEYWEPNIGTVEAMVASVRQV